MVDYLLLLLGSITLYNLAKNTFTLDGGLDIPPSHVNTFTLNVHKTEHKIVLLAACSLYEANDTLQLSGTY